MQQKGADSGFVRNELPILQNKGFKGRLFGGENGCGFFACRIPGVDIRGKICLMKAKLSKYSRESLQSTASYVNHFEVCIVHAAATAVHFFF
jgi:hypothetical protein